MINAGEYVKALLRKRNMSQMDLLRKIEAKGMKSDLHKEHLSYALNIKMTYTWARKIEIALELPDYSLIAMIGTPSEYEWKVIKGIGKNV